MDTGTTLALLNTGRYYHAAFTVNDNAYVAGGMGSVSYTNSVEKYDPETNVWSYVSNMPTSRISHSSFVLKDEGYVIGGTLGTNNSFTMWKYNPTRNTWRTHILIQRVMYILNDNTSMLYTSPISISAPSKLQIWAIADGSADSDILEIILKKKLSPPYINKSFKRGDI